MKQLLLSLTCLCALCSFAQTHTPAATETLSDTGVHFQHNLSWQQTLAKAKAEHKYIFVDGFTTWCGPCRYMSKNIFPQKAVGDVMNAKFIAVKMQLDTSDADNAEVKKRYADAHALATDYKINVYPTYLFFSPDGKLVHRAVGSSEAGAFIAKLNDALNPETQYYTQLAKYKEGKKDSAFLHRLTTAAMEAYDMQNASAVAGDYLTMQPDLYTPENLAILSQVTQSSHDKGFPILLEHADKVDAVMGKGTAGSIVQGIILHEEVNPLLYVNPTAAAKDWTEPNWNTIEKNLQSKYPAQAAPLLAYSKVVFYMRKGDWNQFGPAVVAYLKSYGDDVSDNQLNEYAWKVFQNCNDETCLQNALDWSKRSFDKSGTPGYMDTYANILYRLGKKDEALQWEQKAMDNSPEDEKAGYQQTIDKMKAGEKTWN